MHATRVEKEETFYFTMGRLELQHQYFMQLLQGLLRLARHIALIKTLKTGRHTSTFVPLSLQTGASGVRMLHSAEGGRIHRLRRLWSARLWNYMSPLKLKPNWHLSVTHARRGRLGLSCSIHTNGTISKGRQHPWHSEVITYMVTAVSVHGSHGAINWGRH